MGRYIGVDLGTTSIAAVVLDTAAQMVVAQRTAPNHAEVTSAGDRGRGRSEWDSERMVEIALGLLGAAAEEAGGGVDGIGVTGQQHGMVLLDAAGRPWSPFIGWQDQRCLDALADGQTTIAHMLQRGGNGFRKSGCVPATGYMGSTLFWLQEAGDLAHGVRACFAPDCLVAELTGKPTATDPTLAASAGVLDVARGVWNDALIADLGLPREVLPEVGRSCTVAGETVGEGGLAAGIPVAVPCGDNQASFAGSVADYEASVLVNIGTGGQASLFTSEALVLEGLDLRPFLQGGFLLVGAGLAGGRAYRVLRDFIGEVGREFFAPGDPEAIYERLNALAAPAPAGAEGLRCEPIFAGTRHEPGRRAVWRGMSEANFRPGHMARALLEGLAEQYRQLYERMLEGGAGARERLIGSGNGIRKNPLLADILSRTFDMPLQTPIHTEEAAVGAALTAAVAVGEYATIEDAGRAFIRYRGVC